MSWFCAVQVFPGKEGSVDLVASRDIQASESLYLSYGNLDNDFLLLDYGQPPYPSLVICVVLSRIKRRTDRVLMWHFSKSLCRVPGALESI